jgi:hypothetical protein
MRGFIWTDMDAHVSPSAKSTEIDIPLPRPPAQELRNPVTSNTIRTNLDLFKVVTPININAFSEHLRTHPNQPLVESVCTGLREGFWPWSDVSKEPSEVTRDYSHNGPLDEDELNFLRDTCVKEQDAGRYSDGFGPNLLPGMVSEPMFAVPKPRSSKLRLVNHHSAGEFSLNDTIPKEDRSIRLDNLHDLGRMLRAFHRRHGRGPRWVYKSDVSSAYRLMPMHPHWQIRQIVSLQDGAVLRRFVDRCCCFGNGGSPRIWCTFFGLVIWIAVFVSNITDLLHYMDDAFGIDDNPDLEYYGPYECSYPKKQVLLLKLWDRLGIPHEKKKQEFGPSLEIIGLYVDPQQMTITMDEDRRALLIEEVDNFIACGRHPRLIDWQRLAGWIHWSLNAYPLLRPALNPFHAKIAGKTHRFATIPLNKEVTISLTWFRDRVSSVPGVSILEAEEWSEEDADLVIWCDACTGDKQRPAGLGFWIPQLLLGFFGQGPDEYPPNLQKTGSIFFLEALCVLSALNWASTLPTLPTRLLIYTDSINTADMFSSLRAEPGYNDILMAAVEILLDKQFSLRVFHVAGKDNTIADALSRSYFDVIHQSQPRLKLHYFQPPRLDAGVAQK